MKSREKQDKITAIKYKIFPAHIFLLRMIYGKAQLIYRYIIEIFLTINDK